MSVPSDKSGLAGAVERQWAAKAAWHASQAQRPLRDKLRTLLDMQRTLLPVIERRRPLRPWEQPWDIEP